MVLEYLVDERHLEKRFSLALSIGIIYSLIGIFLAKLIFSASMGVAAVIFTAILLIPSLRKMFSHEQRVEEQEHRFIWKHFIKDNKQLIKTYLGIFIGVYATFFLYAIIASQAGASIAQLFPEQAATQTLAGQAIGGSTFLHIVANNFLVLLVCFLLSILSGSGAIFFIVWNASLWAVVFAARSVAAAMTMQQPLLALSSKLIAITAPHVFFEGMSYILAGIAGAVISKDVLAKQESKQGFIIWLMIILALFFGFLIGLQALGIEVFFLFKIMLFLLLFYFLRTTFKVQQHKEVFVYNYWLFIIAIICFLLGAAIEVMVLHHSGFLASVYGAAITA